MALKHCMMRPPGHRVVHSADPYLDPKMLLANADVRREFAPTAQSSSSSERVTGETWKKTIDWILATTKSLLQQTVFKKADMDYEGYVAMDKLITGLRIKWGNLTEAATALSRSTLRSR